jgi:hypothetical protein
MEGYSAKQNLISSIFSKEAKIYCRLLKEKNINNVLLTITSLFMITK